MTSYADRFLTGFSVITPAGERVTFEMHRRNAPHWVYPKESWQRGYMSGSHKDHNKKPRMYVGCEETLLENLMNRTTRPANAWGRTIRAAMKVAGLEGTIGWYNKAGCSCPCSPGFIWTNAPYIDGYHTYDVSVHIAGAPVVRDDAEANLEQLHRLEQLAADPTLPIAALANTVL